MKLEILLKLIALANNNPNDNEANLAARKACKAIIEHKFTITGGTQIPPKTTTPPPSPRPNTSSYHRDPFWDYVDFEDIFGGGRRGGKSTEQREREARAEKERQEARAREARRQQEEARRRQEQHYKPKSDQLKEREHNWQYEYYVAATGQFYNPISRKHYNQMFQDLWYQETGTRHVSDTAAFRASANYGRPEGEGTKSSNPYNKTGNKDDDKYYQRKRERGFGDEDRKLKCKTCGKHINTKFMGIPEMFECNDCQWTAYQRKKEQDTKFDHVCHMTGRGCNTPVTCASNGCQQRT